MYQYIPRNVPHILFKFHTGRLDQTSLVSSEFYSYWPIRESASRSQMCCSTHSISRKIIIFWRNSTSEILVILAKFDKRNIGVT